MKTTLLIMAAGIGSRFGEGIKQLSAIDDRGHIIMDYSIHDAIEAGFDRIIFIIRRDIEADFRDAIGSRIEAVCCRHNVEVGYAFQRLDDIPGSVPEGRVKPWGTGQAVLAAKAYIDAPFAVINADDYYGKKGLKAVRDYLLAGTDACMAGYRLKNTLSDHGGVTRGICKMDGGWLTEIDETRNIVRTSCGAEANGAQISPDSLVSMNMWGFRAEFIDVLERGFEEFFRDGIKADPLKAEFLIPSFVGTLLQRREIAVRVLETDDVWYGMTYREDVAYVRSSFERMIREGIYSCNLFD